jgi:hypothetical protein
MYGPLSGLPPRWFSVAATRDKSRCCLQVLSQLGKIGSLLFSLILGLPRYTSAMLRIVFAVTL